MNPATPVTSARTPRTYRTDAASSGVGAAQHERGDHRREGDDRRARRPRHAVVSAGRNAAHYGGIVGGPTGPSCNSPVAVGGYRRAGDVRSAPPAMSTCALHRRRLSHTLAHRGAGVRWVLPEEWRSEASAVSHAGARWS